LTFGRSELGKRKRVPLLLPQTAGRPSDPIGGCLTLYISFHPAAADERRRGRRRAGCTWRSGSLFAEPAAHPPGLELLHTTSGQWLPVRLDTVVLWCGATAIEVTKGLSPASYQILLEYPLSLIKPLKLGSCTFRKFEMFLKFLAPFCFRTQECREDGEANTVDI